MTKSLHPHARLLIALALGAPTGCADAGTVSDSTSTSGTQTGAGSDDPGSTSSSTGEGGGTSTVGATTSTTTTTTASGPGGGSDGTGGDGAGGDGGAGGSSDVGSGGGGAIECLGQRCRADQVCGDAGCRFPCDGVDVPGDYGTPAAAVDALQMVGGTICLHAGDYTNLDVEAFIHEDLTIIGDSAATVDVGTIRLRGLGDEGLGVPGARIRLVGMSTRGVELDFTTGPEDLAVELVGLTTFGGPFGVNLRGYAAEGTEVLIDGCELAPPTSPAIQIAAVQVSAHLDLLRVESSWLHDTGVGIRVDGVASVGVEVANVTFERSDIGLQTGSSVQPRYANNVFRDNEWAVWLDSAGDGHHNAYEGNLTKFGSEAVPGDGDVDGPLGLDGAAPPGPASPASTCVDAGDPGMAPEHDFWGRPRGAAPDLGAVELAAQR